MTSAALPTTAPLTHGPLPRGLAETLGQSLGDDPAALEGRLYVAPSGLLRGAPAAAAVAAGRARWLVGGPLAFSGCDVFLRTGAEAGSGIKVSHGGLPELAAWARAEGPAVGRFLADRLSAFQQVPAPLDGMALDRPLVMGILNVTPDSFSDGGDHATAEAAIAHGRAMLAAGADLIDVGGESTRPGAETVPPEAETARVVPVVRALAEAGAVVSIDSRNAATMGAALEAGAALVNDVTALTHDPLALPLVAEHRAPVVLMHIQGRPQTMQADPRYACAPLDVYDWLAGRLAACAEAGIPAERLLLDPGIGFGKTVAHNMELLSHLGLLLGLGAGLLLGVSRKSFIARLDPAEPPPKARLAGSLTAALAGLDQGARILRVHDVAETAQAVAVWRGLNEAA
ncbi:dihydropteroate synthase [Roseospirillum parvum]|uniref:dihydropteroate synthase n=1 Tax=Roseospirillum parvum TaxID=83401 RepID=A0A1G7XPB2_9PROT|nr:dihydropteroate synthase [Roseospirillum parvum]SDG85951.1 dihydropteroate synthase [Roseospirillum parvum]